MLIVAGTTNPTKIAGVKRAFKVVFPHNSIEVVGVKVNNVVGKQPIGFDEIYIGAYFRARNAMNIYRSAEFYVGVEAGIVNVHGHWIDLQLAIVLDRDGKLGIGLSPGFPLAKKFVNEILEHGYELEEVVDRYYGTRDIGSHGGLIKLLTKDIITREDLVYYAVLTALIPWMNRDVYD